jgi:hypothetical protein
MAISMISKPASKSFPLFRRPKTYPPWSSFRPELLACRPSDDPSTCLHLDQIESFRKLYTTYVDSAQNYLSAPYNLGGELLWGTYGVSTPTPWLMAEHFYKYFVLK